MLQQGGELKFPAFIIVVGIRHVCTTESKLSSRYRSHYRGRYLYHNAAIRANEEPAVHLHHGPQILLPVPIMSLLHRTGYFFIQDGVRLSLKEAVGGSPEVEEDLRNSDKGTPVGRRPGDDLIKQIEPVDNRVHRAYDGKPDDFDVHDGEAVYRARWFALEHDGEGVGVEEVTSCVVVGVLE